MGNDEGFYIYRWRDWKFINLIHKPATPKENFNPIKPDPSSSCDPYRVFNIGNSKPVPLAEIHKRNWRMFGD